MFPTALSIGLRTLATNPLRTFLSTLGVIIGTAALVAVIALGDGVERYAREQIASQTDLQQFVVRAETERRVDGLWLPRSDTAAFGPADVASLEAALDAPGELRLMRSGGTLVGGLRGDSLRGAMIETLDQLPDEPPPQVAGRPLTPDEMTGDAALVVVSPDLAALIASGHDSAVGRVVTLAGAPFTVIGVAGTAGAGETLLAAQVPLGAYERAVPLTEQRPAVIVATMADIDATPVAVAAARAWARGRWNDGVEISNRQELLVEVRRGMMVAKLLMGSITGISLLVGGIGIMNVLLASVIERTREIGIRRAAGARRRDIIGQFLAESVVITGAGSALGLAIGMLGAFGVSWLMRAQSDAPVHAAFTPLPIVVATASAVIIGLVFGIYPAMRAANLSPIDAIRTE